MAEPGLFKVMNGSLNVSLHASCKMLRIPSSPSFLEHTSISMLITHAFYTPIAS